MTLGLKRFLGLTVLCVLFGGLVADAHPAASQSWTGTLVDATCYFDHPSDTGNTHEGMEKCGEACLRLGRPAGIVTAGKKFMVLIVPAPDIAKYAGETIRATGRMNSGIILVEKFGVRQGADWQTVRLSAIM